MFDLLSSPILVTIIVGSVGLAILVIDAARREKVKDNNNFYSEIAFTTIIASMAIIVLRVLTGDVVPAVALFL